MSKFQPLAAYDTASGGQYQLLPHKFTRLDGDRYVLTNMVGEYAVVPRQTDPLRVRAHQTAFDHMNGFGEGAVRCRGKVCEGFANSGCCERPFGGLFAPDLMTGFAGSGAVWLPPRPFLSKLYSDFSTLRSSH